MKNMSPSSTNRLLTAQPVRKLTAEQLEIVPNDSIYPSQGGNDYSNGIAETSSAYLDSFETSEDVYGLAEMVETLLADGYSGVIFSGPPGTSKSWYASSVALLLADQDPTRVRQIQFHPSYQYEDFVEGLVPQATGEFTWKDRH